MIKRFKEQLIAIWAIMKGGQYAVFVVDNGYVNSKTTPNKAVCIISDNASDLFLASIAVFTENYALKRNSK